MKKYTDEHGKQMLTDNGTNLQTLAVAISLISGAILIGYGLMSLLFKFILL